jgi:hypothetical protein
LEEGIVNRKSCLAVATILFAIFFVCAASGEEYRIDSVSYEIDGRTQERALANVLEIDFARVFPDRAALDAYVADRTQILHNQRVLEDGSIEVQELAAEEGKPLPVRLTVKTKDSHSIIALPKPQYDSNNGLLLSLRARDYNFLGSMQRLAVDLNYTGKSTTDQGVEAALTFDLPFRLGDLDYTWNMDMSFAYAKGNGFNSTDTTGVQLILPLGPGKLSFGPSQSYYLNPDNADGSPFDGWFLKEAASGTYTLDLLDMGYFGKLDASMTEELRKYWSPTGLDLLAEREGLAIDSTQKLSFSRIDWIGNLRRGLAASSSVEEIYNLENGDWTRYLKADVEGYRPLLSRLGVSGRLMAFRDLDDRNDSAGDALRGILDKRIDTDAAIYANLDLPATVLNFMPQEWLGKDWMRYFAFELQCSPFLDAALTHDKETGRWFSLRDAWLAGGLELIAFPLSFRSAYVRVSVGWDLPAVLETKSLTGYSSRDGESAHEIFIGLGNHY